MSVICMNDLGAFLDHLPLTSYSILSNKQNETNNGAPASESSTSDSSYSGEIQDGKVKAYYRWKQELFAVDAPFMMDSQAERLKREAFNVECGEVIKESSAQRKRRKKSQKEIVLSGLEKKISTVISKALPGLIEHARELRCLHDIPLHPSENNQSAREASQIAGCGNLFPNLCCAFEEDRLRDCRSSSDVMFGGGEKTDSRSSSDVIVLNEERDLSYRSRSIIGRHVCNLDDNVQVIQVDNHQFLVPPRSSFVTSSFHHFVGEGYKQIQVKTGYDLIVLDPPWVNKSVKRKKSYHTIDETDLKKIPVNELAGHDSLICVWVTNNERLKVFVTDELFPHWSVDFIAEWIWLKITRKGEPVCDILSAHKKPYEQLIIGRLAKHPERLAAEPYVVREVASTDVQHDTSDDCRSCVIGNVASTDVQHDTSDDCRSYVVGDVASTDVQHDTSDDCRSCVVGDVASTDVQHDTSDDCRSCVVGDVASTDVQHDTSDDCRSCVVGDVASTDVQHDTSDDCRSCVVGDVASTDVQHDTSDDCRSFVGDTTDELSGIPPDFLLASVPCSLHSKKPSLAGVLSRYLPTNPCCLELFARNLTPGWVSWGFEIHTGAKSASAHWKFKSKRSYPFGHTDLLETP